MNSPTANEMAFETLCPSASYRQESLGTLFDDHEIIRLEAARTAVRSREATIVYCVYENPFAKSGGIFAVADNYGAALQQAGVKSLILSPLHSKLRTAPQAADVRPIGECWVAFDGASIGVEIFEHVRNGVRWILLRADGFFEADGGAGRSDPYVDSDPAGLLRDSLFMSAAVPEALAAMGERENLIVHVQDWELAATALTVKLALLEGRLESAAVVLTSHNPYDHALPAESLQWIANRQYRRTPQPGSMYQCMMPLTDGPVTTVSRNFAKELTSDPLQTQYFADHLQQIFRQQGIVGVDNGLFGKPEQAYSDQALRAMATGDPAAILAEKRAKRKRMLQELEAYTDARILGRLHGSDGGPLSQLADDVPVFMMFGRMDPGQKGFDVLTRAIERLPRGWGRFILTPIVAGGQTSFADDLKRLAAARPGEVVVYPFRMERGYAEAMGGSTYAVMPSLYEPFGGTTEPYLAGTPVVARATGGLVQQVSDIDSDSSGATGLLFREPVEGTGQQWRTVQTAPTPEARLAVPFYASMVEALVRTLVRAGEIYQSDPATYGAMLSHLFERAQLFSWRRAVAEYASVYQLATTPPRT